ncbi:hypothetical protein HanXRQr2_Chr08g0335011 [Helianthus annuus]|uniref:Uncharacterized protein n=1 Tax=Helianthus annuus TaxID=4232 RepID=A0A9K3DKS2_HELAN|nr:hypothetical protein HanXRQr2_Chr17g0820251 [Helianthus annuus]KAF5795033.1 hypothetical protein HanXRQr2_Chr08g0335011 [Helianthus annuus]KAJ0814583.1 hypothetical protein HanPSC8_Chr17g0787401 [Helianthus annuus]KAJ0892775.1 hypothetical protein HanPSC8_Chr09g0369991 [Helianthus annuus]
MTSQSKFTLRIVNAPLPAKLKMPPTLKFYDGTSDPDDHMFATKKETHGTGSS